MMALRGISPWSKRAAVVLHTHPVFDRRPVMRAAESDLRVCVPGNLGRIHVRRACTTRPVMTSVYRGVVQHTLIRSVANAPRLRLLQVASSVKTLPSHFHPDADGVTSMMIHRSYALKKLLYGCGGVCLLKVLPDAEVFGAVWMGKLICWFATTLHLLVGCTSLCHITQCCCCGGAPHAAHGSLARSKGCSKGAAAEQSSLLSLPARQI